MDMVFLFGFRLVFFIFIVIVDLVEWILVYNYGVDFFRYYFDDFFILGLLVFFICYNNL